MCPPNSTVTCTPPNFDLETSRIITVKPYGRLSSEGNRGRSSILRSAGSEGKYESRQQLASYSSTDQLKTRGGYLSPMGQAISHSRQ